MTVAAFVVTHGPDPWLGRCLPIAFIGLTNARLVISGARYCATSHGTGTSRCAIIWRDVVDSFA